MLIPFQYSKPKVIECRKNNFQFEDGDFMSLDFVKITKGKIFKVPKEDF